MEPNIRIMIVDDMDNSRDGIARLLDFEPDLEVVGFAGTGAEALAMLPEVRPDVILMDINMPDMDGITATREIARLRRRVAVVMISVQHEQDYMRRAMQVGAKDFLPKPPSADELYATVRLAYQRLLEEPEAPDDPGDVGPKPSGKVIVVYSPSGGAGVTTLAVNLASGLMAGQERAVLVDADLQFGDVAMHLALQHELNITDAVRLLEDLDEKLIDQVTALHGSGLRVLRAPNEPHQAERINGEDMVQLVNKLAEHFAYVVIDTAVALNDVTLTLLERADALIMVGTPILPSVRNIKVTLELFEHFEDFDADKIMLVLNKVVTSTGRVEPAAIGKTLRLPVAATIPTTDKPMLDALNYGVPVIVRGKQSPGAEILALIEQVRSQLAGNAAVEPVEPPVRRRRFRLLG